MRNPSGACIPRMKHTNLEESEDYYNHHRPHGALASQTQYAQLLAKARAGASPAS
jgi:transposase InsO family protein